MPYVMCAEKRETETIMQNRTRDFRSEVRRIKNCRAGVGGIVDGFSDSADIADMFASKYADLYSSVSYDCVAMTGINSDINAAVTTFTDDCVVCYRDVAEAVSFLKPNKTDGHAGIIPRPCALWCFKKPLIIILLLKVRSSVHCLTP